MSEVQRPPASGPGSSVDAWRRYAATVTDSPLDAWADLSREGIMDLLSSEGVDQPSPSDVGDRDSAPAGQRRPAGRRPAWMVATPDGRVPEHDLRRRDGRHS